MAEDDFQLVTSAKKKKWSKKKKNQKIKHLASQQVEEEEEETFDTAKCVMQIQNIRNSMEVSEFWRTFKDATLGASWSSLEVDLKELVLYGIGSIGNSAISKHQLSFVILLAEYLKLRVLFYDPVLSADELDIMKNLNLTYIPENEECKRTVEVPTLFVMLHCGKAMYNNLLWANWDRLSQIAIIGNAFSSYNERLPSRSFSESVPFIHKIIPFTKEAAIGNNYLHDDIFNDTSVHVFPEDLLRGAESDVWSNVVEPTHSQDDVEIITKKEGK